MFARQRAAKSNIPGYAESCQPPSYINPSSRPTSLPSVPPRPLPSLTTRWASITRAISYQRVMTMSPGPSCTSHDGLWRTPRRDLVRLPAVYTILYRYSMLFRLRWALSKTYQVCRATFVAQGCLSDDGGGQCRPPHLARELHPWASTRDLGCDERDHDVMYVAKRGWHHHLYVLTRLCVVPSLNATLFQFAYAYTAPAARQMQFHLVVF